VLLFDPAKVNDPASYQEPHQLAEGVTHIVVNGVLVREGGTFTRELPGRVLTPERRWEAISYRLSVLSATIAESTES
jgi:N-acyl-D-aspartate/D-glutamate deacylase